MSENPSLFTFIVEQPPFRNAVNNLLSCLMNMRNIKSLYRTSYHGASFVSTISLFIVFFLKIVTFHIGWHSRLWTCLLCTWDNNQNYIHGPWPSFTFWYEPKPMTFFAFPFANVSFLLPALSFMCANAFRFLYLNFNQRFRPHLILWVVFSIRSDPFEPNWNSCEKKAHFGLLSHFQIQ